MRLPAVPVPVPVALAVALAACGSAPEPPAVIPAASPPIAAAAPPAAPPAPTGPTVSAGVITAGPFTIAPVFHGTALILVGGQVWWIDPWSQVPLDARPKADVVLVTDIHRDHLDPAALETVRKPGSVVVAPAAVDAAWDGTADHVLANGGSVEVSGVTVTAVPMYNHTRGPEPGKLYHDKGRGNGYLLEREGTRVYFAGDTACTDEMKALTGIDIAFVPMNLPYTMPPSEAADCVRAFEPTVVVPYHYRDADVGVFEAALGDLPTVRVERLDFYPG